MTRILSTSILITSLIAGPAMAETDPVEARQALMEKTRDAAKVVGGMLKQEREFDAAAAMESFEVWKKTSQQAGELFPEGSETGHDTAAKASIWTDREGFNGKLANFGEAVDAAIAAEPASLEALKEAAQPVFKACKACHEEYRVEKED